VTPKQKHRRRVK